MIRAGDYGPLCTRCDVLMLAIKDGERYYQCPRCGYIK